MRDDGGLDKSNSSGGCETRSDSVYTMKLALTGFPYLVNVEMWGVSERVKR